MRWQKLGMRKISATHRPLFPAVHVLTNLPLSAIPTFKSKLQFWPAAIQQSVDQPAHVPHLISFSRATLLTLFSSCLPVVSISSLPPRSVCVSVGTSAVIKSSNGRPPKCLKRHVTLPKNRRWTPSTCLRFTLPHISSSSLHLVPLLTSPFSIESISFRFIPAGISLAVRGRWSASKGESKIVKKI